jgi:hypothetical protein
MDKKDTTSQRQQNSVRCGRSGVPPPLPVASISRSSRTVEVGAIWIQNDTSLQSGPEPGCTGLSALIVGIGGASRLAGGKPVPTTAGEINTGCASGGAALS